MPKAISKEVALEIFHDYWFNLPDQPMSWRAEEHGVSKKTVSRIVNREHTHTRDIVLSPEQEQQILLNNNSRNEVPKWYKEKMARENAAVSDMKDIRAIRREYNTGYTISEIAERYRVSVSVISRIINYKYWCD